MVAPNALEGRAPLAEAAPLPAVPTRLEDALRGVVTIKETVRNPNDLGPSPIKKYTRRLHEPDVFLGFKILQGLQVSASSKSQKLSQMAAAQLVGCARKTINEACDEGLINYSVAQGVDRVTLEAWDANRRSPRGGLNRKYAKPQLMDDAAVSADGPAASNAAEAIDRLISGGIFPNRQAAELARDSYVAHLKQIELEKERGRLLDSEAVTRWVAVGVTSIRTRFLALPSEIAPALTRCKTAAETQDVLRSAVIEVLDELTGHFAKGF